MWLSLIVYVTSFMVAPLLGVAIYLISIALSLRVPVGNFVVTVILGIVPVLPCVISPPVVPLPPAPPPLLGVFVIGFVLLLGV